MTKATKADRMKALKILEEFRGREFPVPHHVTGYEAARLCRQYGVQPFKTWADSQRTSVVSLATVALRIAVLKGELIRCVECGEED